MKALVMIADGIEELETVTTTDLLVRGGFEVILASVSGLTVTAARGLKLTADVLMQDVKGEYEVLVCPGGLGGAENLAKNPQLGRLLVDRHEKGQWIAAICASPALVLAPLNILSDHRATCYPSFQAHLPQFVTEPVVVDRHIITSQGPATAAQFALAIIHHLKGEAVAADVSKQALYS